jgi:hypothetical protein
VLIELRSSKERSFEVVCRSHNIARSSFCLYKRKIIEE